VSPHLDVHHDWLLERLLLLRGQLGRDLVEALQFHTADVVRVAMVAMDLVVCLIRRTLPYNSSNST